MKTVECSFSAEGIGHRLSNLYPYAFTYGIEFASMEGFFQSLKFSDAEVRLQIAKLAGYEAYHAGQSGNDWRDEQLLYWCEEVVKRSSKRYSEIVSGAFDACMEQNPEFAANLLLSGNALLQHSIGRYDQHRTTLLPPEYLYNLYRLRARLQQLDNSES